MNRYGILARIGDLFQGSFSSNLGAKKFFNAAKDDFHASFVPIVL
jgi:hypothetical protein